MRNIFFKNKHFDQEEKVVDKMKTECLNNNNVEDWVQQTTEGGTPS